MTSCHHPIRTKFTNLVGHDSNQEFPCKTAYTIKIVDEGVNAERKPGPANLKKGYSLKIAIMGVSRLVSLTFLDYFGF